MPEIIVYLLEGRTIEAKRELVKDITAAVVKNLGAPAEGRHGFAGRNPEDGKRQRRGPL
jgi:hypothetical protein